MNKSVFTLPLPIELQFKIFKYEHVSMFKKCLNQLFIKCDSCGECINSGDYITIDCGTRMLYGEEEIFYFHHQKCFFKQNNFIVASHCSKLTSKMFFKIKKINTTFVD